MKELNQRIRHLEMPDRMRHLPISDEGYPIPYFVPYYSGKPEFRGFDPDKMRVCVRHQRCWLCGEQLGRFMTFTIGPMCAVNRVSAEPPSHYDCARYAAEACPFLSQPRMRRNEKDMPEDSRPAAGIAIKRNPGIAMLWVTRGYKPFKANGGVLFEVDPPQRVEFYAEGRKATHDEIMASIDSGMPILREMAEQDGPEAVAELEQMYAKAMEVVP
jgi:hypothetical protein